MTWQLFTPVQVPPNSAEFYAYATSSATQHDNDLAAVYIAVEKVYTPTVSGAQSLTINQSGNISSYLTPAQYKGNLRGAAHLNSFINGVNVLILSVAGGTTTPSMMKSKSITNSYSSAVKSTANVDAEAGGNYATSYAEGNL